MIKALFTYDYGEEKMNQVRQLGYDVVLRPERDLVCDEGIRDTEVLVCYSPFQTLDISQLEALKWIQLSSIGIDQVPVEKAKAMNLLIANNRGGYSVPMGEWIVHKILEIYKQGRYFTQMQQLKRWKLTTDIYELKDKRIGFIGTGTIAQEAAKRLKGFEPRLLGFNTSGRHVQPFDECFSVRLLDHWMNRFDILVLAVPSTESTQKIINRSRLRKMKDSAVIINVSRGSVLDESALAELLGEGKFMGVALDVFEQEPLPLESPLWNNERVYVTPHNSWVSEMRNERRFDIILENLKRYAEKRSLLNLVDLDRGY